MLKGERFFSALCVLYVLLSVCLWAPDYAKRCHLVDKSRRDLGDRPHRRHVVSPVGPLGTEWVEKRPPRGQKPQSPGRQATQDRPHRTGHTGDMSFPLSRRNTELWTLCVISTWFYDFTFYPIRSIRRKFLLVFWSRRSMFTIDPRITSVAF